MKVSTGAPGSLVGKVVAADLERVSLLRAYEFASDYPTVRPDTPVIEAARLLAGQDLPGFIVVDGRGASWAILAGTQVLHLAVPQYCQDDPNLARVIDEAAADVFLRGLGERSVAASLPKERPDLPVVHLEATVLEVAAVMARTRVPLVAVVDSEGVLQGAITLDTLLDRVLAQ